MQLSSQTVLGLKMTSKSIVVIVKTLLTSGASFVLTSHINQDALEQLFGHCRHKAGLNDYKGEHSRYPIFIYFPK